jgi:hypothetical protein
VQFFSSLQVSERDPRAYPDAVFLQLFALGNLNFLPRWNRNFMQIASAEICHFLLEGKFSPRRTETNASYTETALS